MATQFPFGVGQNDSHGAELIRRMIAVEYASVGGVGGTASAAHLKVVQHGAGAMSVDVNAGECVVPGSLSTWQGKYYFLNDATISALAIAASNPSNPRWDAVVGTIVDTAYAGASDSVTVQVITGTPAASPAYPTLPANSYLLAYVYVGAGVSSILSANITDMRNLLASNGPLALNPAARAYYNATGTAASGAPLTTSWVVSGTAVNMTVGTTGITCIIPGKYHVSYHGGANTTGGGYVYTELFKNGTGVSQGTQAYLTASGAAYSAGADDVQLATGDLLQVGTAESVTLTGMVNDPMLGCWMAAHLVSQ